MEKEMASSLLLLASRSHLNPYLLHQLLVLDSNPSLELNLSLIGPKAVA